MEKSALMAAIVVSIFTASARAQAPATRNEPVPVYRVTVVEHTIAAINYQYRSLPTKIDFRGTVLLPQARGEATVESKLGHTVIDAKFEGLLPPHRYGAEYLTYVLWAITPEGRPKNLGEAVADASDKGKLRVTTDLQAFGLIVTAEPHSAVKQPSDVVVLENQVRPDTVGKVEQVQARYELMPRGHYVYNVPANLQAPSSQSRKVPLDRYHAILELYEAQNAVQIARSAGADRDAADVLQKAERLLREAENLNLHKGSTNLVVTTAREAAQTAEDSREVAIQRRNARKLAEADRQVEAEREKLAKAESDARQAAAQAEASRASLEAEQAQLQNERTQLQAEQARLQPEQPPQTVAARPAPFPSPSEDARKAARVELLRQLNSALATRDTPRGLVLTIPDHYFAGAALHPQVQQNLDRIAAILRARQGLRLEVEGHTDSASETTLSQKRADAVRDCLVHAGVPASEIITRGLGSSRPVASNAVAQGRLANRRVEIVISGDPIGNLAYWEQTYTLTPRLR